MRHPAQCSFLLGHGGDAARGLSLFSGQPHAGFSHLCDDPVIEKFGDEAGAWVKVEAVLMMYGWNMTGWGWAWMTVWALVGIGILALLVLAAVRTSRPDRNRADDSALALLQRRFAAGEIDSDEYRRRRAELEGDQPSSRLSS